MILYICRNDIVSASTLLLSRHGSKIAAALTDSVRRHSLARSHHPVCRVPYRVGLLDSGEAVLAHQFVVAVHEGRRVVTSRMNNPCALFAALFTFPVGLS